jgi:hypothetical protein
MIKSQVIFDKFPLPKSCNHVWFFGSVEELCHDEPRNFILTLQYFSYNWNYFPFFPLLFKAGWTYVTSFKGRFRTMH